MSIAGVLGYAIAGMFGRVPWHTTAGSTAASGVWLALAGVVLILGTRRIRAAEYATSRRGAYRNTLDTPLTIDGTPRQLLDISMSGIAIRVPAGTLPDHGFATVHLPGAPTVTMNLVRPPNRNGAYETAALRATDGDWTTLHTIALWLFHTPDNAVVDLPCGIPAIACISR